MNALYLGMDGAVVQRSDRRPRRSARDGHVRFVGDAPQRIDEDVLRLLRFYRFFAHYGKGAADEGGARRDGARGVAPLLPNLVGGTRRGPSC